MIFEIANKFTVVGAKQEAPVFYVQLEVKQFISHKRKICKQFTIQQYAKIIKLRITSKVYKLQTLPETPNIMV